MKDPVSATYRTGLPRMFSDVLGGIWAIGATSSTRIGIWNADERYEVPAPAGVMAWPESKLRQLLMEARAKKR